MLHRVRLCGALPYLGAATESQHTPYARAERARVDHTAYNPHPRTRGFHIEGHSSRASDPCIPACASQCVVAPHRQPEPQAWRARARRAGRVGPGWPHGPWRLPAIEGTPHGRHFPPRITILVLTPPSKRYQQHASARSWHRLVAPSCCPSARGRRIGPFQCGTGSMDATCASCLSPVGPAGSCHCHGLQRIPRHLCSLCSPRVPFRRELPRTRQHGDNLCRV